MTSEHSSNPKTLSTEEPYEKTLKEGRILKKEVVEGILEAYHKNVGYFEDSNSPTTHIRNMEFFYAMAIHELLQLKKSPKEENAANDKNTNIPLEKDLDARITLYAESLQVLLYNSSKLKTIKQSNIAGWLRVYYKHSRHGSIPSKKDITKYARSVYTQIEPYLKQSPQKHKAIPELPYTKTTPDPNRGSEVLNISDLTKYKISPFLPPVELATLQKVTRVVVEDTLHSEYLRPATMEELRGIKDKPVAVLDLRLLLASLCGKQEAAWSNVPLKTIRTIGETLELLKKCHTIHLGALNLGALNFFSKKTSSKRVNTILTILSQHAKHEGSNLKHVSLVPRECHEVEKLLQDTNKLRVTAYVSPHLLINIDLTGLKKTYTNRFDYYTHPIHPKTKSYHKVFAPKDLEELEKLEGQTVGTLDLRALTATRWDKAQHVLNRITIKNNIVLGDMSEFILIKGSIAKFENIWRAAVLNPTDREIFKNHKTVLFRVSGNELQRLNGFLEGTGFWKSYPITTIHCSVKKVAKEHMEVFRKIIKQPNFHVTYEETLDLEDILDKNKDGSSDITIPENILCTKIECHELPKDYVYKKINNENTISTEHSGNKDSDTDHNSFMEEIRKKLRRAQQKAKTQERSRPHFILKHMGTPIEVLLLWDNRIEKVTFGEGVYIKHFKYGNDGCINLSENVTIREMELACDVNPKFNTEEVPLRTLDIHYAEEAREKKHILYKAVDLKQLRLFFHSPLGPIRGVPQPDLTSSNFLICLLRNPSLNARSVDVARTTDNWYDAPSPQRRNSYDLSNWFNLRNKLLENDFDEKDILTGLTKDELRLLGDCMKNLEGYLGYLKDRKPNNDDHNKKDINSNEPKASYSDLMYNLFEKIVNAKDRIQPIADNLKETSADNVQQNQNKTTKAG